MFRKIVSGSRQPSIVNRDSDVTWGVCAPFIDAADSGWISDFVESDRHQFVKVAHDAGDSDWHQKKKQVTGLDEWRGFAATATEVVDAAISGNGGVITVFPQLATAAAAVKRFRRSDVPLVAWFFNTTFDSTPKSMLARPALRAVDQFVVHSTAEIEAYATHLRVPAERFSFAHVQYGGVVQTDAEATDDPFVFATGSGFRDYGTLFDAVGKLGVKTKIVAGPRVLAGLTPPSNVEILEGIDRQAIHQLVRQATVNVLPMNNNGLTAGLITMAEAFRHGRSLVVSDRHGIDDYVEHDVNALLVPVGDADAMAGSIQALLDDAGLRERLNKGALDSGDCRHTDNAAADRLVEVLDAVLDGKPS